MVDEAMIAVIDDDESVRESLPDLLRQLGFSSQAFASAEAFLGSELLGQARCLVLDVAMPGMSGIELQRELVSRGQLTPVIFITAQPADTLRPHLLAQGAVACLSKPFSDTDLLAAIEAAL